jgi:hypothetical protein
MTFRHFVTAAACVAMAGHAAAQSGRATAWTAEFNVDKKDLSATGRNLYFILEPGYQLAFEHDSERLTITVLTETKVVDGVTTRVVEERETKGGAPVEVSRNYFAISARTKDVFYFGEDVDMYKGGKVVDHEGSWLAGVDGARLGLMMPGTVTLKARFQQEVAPRVAMDRAEIVSATETLTTPAGRFTNCLKIEETTPLEPGAKEYKFYASGIGLVKDGSLQLVRYGSDHR